MLIFTRGSNLKRSVCAALITASRTSFGSSDCVMTKGLSNSESEKIIISQKSKCRRIYLHGAGAVICVIDHVDTQNRTA